MNTAFMGKHCCMLPMDANCTGTTLLGAHTRTHPRSPTHTLSYTTLEIPGTLSGSSLKPGLRDRASATMFCLPCTCTICTHGYSSWSSTTHLAIILSNKQNLLDCHLVLGIWSVCTVICIPVPPRKCLHVLRPSIMAKNSLF